MLCGVWCLWCQILCSTCLQSICSTINVSENWCRLVMIFFNLMIINNLILHLIPPPTIISNSRHFRFGSNQFFIEPFVQRDSQPASAATSSSAARLVLPPLHCAIRPERDHGQLSSLQQTQLQLRLFWFRYLYHDSKLSSGISTVIFQFLSQRINTKPA